MNRKKLIERIERIFPAVTINYEGETFGTPDPPSGKKLNAIEKMAQMESEFAPPRELDWGEIIERLEKNGLVIVNKKDI